MVRRRPEMPSRRFAYNRHGEDRAGGGTHQLRFYIFRSELIRFIFLQVHRLVVVDNEDKVIGVISLSDILKELVLKPCRKSKILKFNWLFITFVELAFREKFNERIQHAFFCRSRTATTTGREYWNNSGRTGFEW